jgi:hypothetical protein
VSEVERLKKRVVELEKAVHDFNNIVTIIYLTAMSNKHVNEEQQDQLDTAALRARKLAAACGQGKVPL